MDAMMLSTTDLSVMAYPTWDFAYSEGRVPYLEEDLEKQQKAEISCFMQKGLVPQIPTVGCDWLSFFLKRISFADLDAQIHQMLIGAELTEYSPSYSASDDLLIVTMNRSGQ
jgi:hypothetical protein